MFKIASAAIVHFILALSLIAQASTAAGPRTEARIALVIGNGAYANVPLKNPTNDARDLAEALKGLGFSVSLLADGDMAAMTRAIRDFGNAIKRPDAVALFYYSGHGVQYQGANYLIPAKADIQNPDELSYSAVNADQVYAKMESSGDRTNIVILDACRNNPFPGAERSMERGLAVVGSAPPQSLIVYATAPGKTAKDGEGRNGVFTTALLKHLAAPGLDAELMIRRVREDVIAATGGAQVPWHNSSIAGAGFSFAGGGRLLVSTDPPGAEIFLDGQRRGLSPLAMWDLPRYSELEVTAKSGSRSASKRLTLSDASEATLLLSLETARGSIQVKTNEKGVRAILDGAEVPMDPAGAIEGVEVGTHSLELEGDSSAFKAEVEVGANAATKVNATLLPMGSMTLTLPKDTVCKIEGMGISDTTSRFNYGQVPAGQYRLTVTGGDYENYAETVRVERGKKLDFAPTVRYTLDYLTAAYGSEIDRLRKAANSGAASASDVDDAEVILKKIEAEGRPELETLAAKAAVLRATLVSLRPALAPAAGQATINSGKSTGILTLTSDPPGMRVIVDGRYTVQTPARLELAPGAHSFEPQESKIGDTPYAAQTRQWINVAPGGEMRVPIRIRTAAAFIEFRHIPVGYTVFVDDEEAGVTPLSGLTVDAGFRTFRFEKAGEKPRVMYQTAMRDQMSIVSWGATEETAIPLARQSIMLDGKPDSWSGVEPLYLGKTDAMSSFLGSVEYGIKAVYICRDDKFLYWRIDFNALNPLGKTAKGVKNGVIAQITIFSSGTFFDLAQVYDRDTNVFKSYTGLLDSHSGGPWIILDEGCISNMPSKAMLVARIPIDKVLKHCLGVSRPTVILAGINEKGKREKEVDVNLPYVDISR